MFVKVFLVATVLCALQCSEVESFEIIKNALKNAAEKVRKFIHPNHVHDRNCKHSHEHEHQHEDIVTTTTNFPSIDVRGGAPNEAQLSSGSQPKLGSAGGVASTTSIYPDDPNAVPDLHSRTIIGAGCAEGFQKVGSNCRAIAG